MKNVPASGKTFEVVTPFYTAAGKSYEIGDILELIEPTGQNPYGWTTHLPAWVVKCKYFSPPDQKSIWTSIWFMAERGMIKEKNLT